MWPRLAHTLKGVSANIIYCEEAAYMDLGVFYEVIVPLMEVKGTATICISTPLGSWNFYSELTEVRDEKGRRVFNVKHIEHGKRPSWKPEESFSKASEPFVFPLPPVSRVCVCAHLAARAQVKAIFGNRKTLFEREILGKIADAANAAFNKKLLDHFFNAPPIEEPHPVLDNVIYVCVDPNGGANASNASGSDTAIVSFFMSRGQLVVRVHANWLALCCVRAQSIVCVCVSVWCVYCCRWPCAGWMWSCNSTGK